MGILTMNSMNSEIGFSIRHMRLSKVRGIFGSFSVKVETGSIEELVEGKIDVEIDVASISTQDFARDKHLISADFFDADRYPKIYFHKTKIEAGEEGLLLLIGDLTIKDVTHSVIFDVHRKPHTTTNWGTEVHPFSCHTVINRKEFKLTYNALIEAGGAFIDENIQIIVELELNN